MACCVLNFVRMCFGERAAVEHTRWQSSSTAAMLPTTPPIHAISTDAVLYVLLATVLEQHAAVFTSSNTSGILVALRWKKGRGIFALN